MSTSQKILVCGDVVGKIDQLFNRVRNIQKKAGAFDMLFCVGDFFGETDSQWQNYNSGALKAPIPTFILGPTKPEHTEYFPDQDGCELCYNITYLGKRGVYTGASGLQVAYVGGLDGVGRKSEDTHFSDKDLETLLVPRMNDSKFRGVDILLTTQWPMGVEKYATAPEGVDSGIVGSPAISQLALGLKPRYHFCGKEGLFYERQPYRNHQVLVDRGQHVTRFLAIAKVGNLEKQKFLYAFNIVPMKQMDPSELIKQPPDVTECPYRYDPTVIRMSTGESEKPDQYFFDSNPYRKNPKGQKRKSYDDRGPSEKKKPVREMGPCWFCLSSPEMEKHLVVSVGEQTYLALAKGGLTEDHLLILPIGHIQSIVSAPADVLDEINKYKTALKKCFKSLGKTVVFFERNYKSSHLQIQVVPLAADLADSVKETMQGCALSQDIELNEIPEHSDIRQIVSEGKTYFYAELPTREKLLYQINKGFPLQFGREALAHDSLLNMPERIDWRNCKSTKEEETEMTKAFRKIFQPFDIMS